MSKEKTVLEMPETPDTAESLKAQIESLQKRLQEEIEGPDEEEKSETVEMPLANIMLSVGHGNSFPKKNVTPAEAAVLCAMHHPIVGGLPVKEINLTEKIQVDPMNLKKMLVGKYGAKKVEPLFPGPVPNFPRTFKRALSIGIETELPKEDLMEFHVKPSNG